MKKILISLVPVLVLFALLSGAAFAPPAQEKIGTVDLSRVFTNYWRTKEADSALQDRRTDWAKSEKELVDSIQKAQEEAKKLDADARDQAVAAEEREKRKQATVVKLKEIDDLKNDFNSLERRARADLDERYVRLRDNLLGEIRAVINSKAKAAGYTLVLDSGTKQPDPTPIVLYSTMEDLTESVLAQLNASRPIEPAAKDSKPSSDKKTSPPDTSKSDTKPEKK